MNILLWVLQALLAMHTAIGAVWKFSNSAEQTMPSLGAIPNGVWLSMAVVELGLALGLIIPGFFRKFAFLVPVAALCIAAEMLIFCVLHLSSGDNTYGSIVYWLVVAAICGFIAYGRKTLRPF